MRIEKEYRKTGFFWLPERKEAKIPGILSICDGGEIELEVVGHFNERIESLHEDDHFSRIVGHVENDGLVTLDDCFYASKTISFGGVSKSKILVHRVLSGAAWEKDEAVVFNTFQFSVDCLDEWVGISGIKVENDWSRRTTTINYESPEKIRMTLNNGMKLDICFAHTLPGFPCLTEAKISQKALFRLESDSVRDMSEFTSIAFKITNLMCFAIDEVVAIKDVLATSSEIMFNDDSEDDDLVCPVSVSIYYKSIPFPEKPPNQTLHKMLFSFDAIKANAQQVFNHWLNAYDYLSPALGLYFSTKSGAQKYLDGKFLALAQGLETYHRRTSSETLMEEGEYESLVREVLVGCPREHVEWLNNRLKHGNEISLGRRLKRIIEPFKEHLGTSSERSRLLRKIVDTRNYLTHYSEDLRDEVAKGRELWILCMRMEAIFSLHFLKVIGFTDGEIIGVVRNSHLLKTKLEESW